MNLPKKSKEGMRNHLEGACSNTVKPLHIDYYNDALATFINGLFVCVSCPLHCITGTTNISRPDHATQEWITTLVLHAFFCSFIACSG